MEEDNLTAAAGERRGAVDKNRTFYEALWSRARLTRPEDFNTWPMVASLLPRAAERLELGPGLRPRLPVAGTHFIDLSATVVRALNAAGALARAGDATALPFADASMNLVCAFDVMEHIDDHLAAFAEVSRVLKRDGVLILSVPLHARLWNDFDRFVGHVRRYDPDQLTAILQRHDLVPRQSAPFGMQPANTRLLNCGIWLLTHQRTPALFCYNWIFLPISILFQKRLHFSDGLPDHEGVDEVVVICRRADAEGAGARDC